MSSDNTTQSSPFPTPQSQTVPPMAQRELPIATPRVPKVVGYAPLPPTARIPTPMAPPVRSPVAEIPRTLPPQLQPANRPRTGAAPSQPQGGTPSQTPRVDEVSNTLKKLDTVLTKITSDFGAFQQAIAAGTTALRGMAAVPKPSAAPAVGGKPSERADGRGGRVAIAGAAVGAAALGAVRSAAAFGGTSGDTLSFISQIPGIGRKYAGVPTLMGYAQQAAAMELPSLQLQNLSRISGKNVSEVLKNVGGGQFAGLGMSPQQTIQLLNQLAVASSGAKLESDFITKMLAAGEDVGSFFGNIGQLRTRGMQAGGAANTARSVFRAVQGMGLQGAAASTVQSQLMGGFLAQRSMNIGQTSANDFFTRVISMGRGDVERGLGVFQRGQAATQGAADLITAPYAGIADRALHAWARQQSGGDPVEALRLIEQVKREGGARFRGIIEGQGYSANTATLALANKGMTLKDTEDLARFEARGRRELTLRTQATTENMGISASMAKADQARMDRLYTGDRAAMARTMIRADLAVEDLQLARMPQTLSEFQTGLASAINTTDTLVSALDKVASFLTTQFQDALQEVIQGLRSGSAFSVAKGSATAAGAKTAESLLGF